MCVCDTERKRESSKWKWGISTNYQVRSEWNTKTIYWFRKIKMCYEVSITILIWYYYLQVGKYGGVADSGRWERERESYRKEEWEVRDRERETKTVMQLKSFCDCKLQKRLKKTEIKE